MWQPTPQTFYSYLIPYVMNLRCLRRILIHDEVCVLTLAHILSKRHSRSDTSNIWHWGQNHLHQAHYVLKVK